MGALFTVFRKEFIENLRDRRTVMAALVMGPLLAPLMFGMMMRFMLKEGVRDPDREVAVAISNGDAAPNLRDHLLARGITLHDFKGDDAAAREAVRTRREHNVRAVPADDGERLSRGTPAPVLLYLDASNTADQRAASSRSACCCGVSTPCCSIPCPCRMWTSRRRPAAGCWCSAC